MRELKIGHTSWISLQRPSNEDIRELAQRFPELHPLVVGELSTPTIRPRVENYDHHLYLVLHFPSFLKSRQKTVVNEIDFILIGDCLITLQYNDFDALDDFWHECESEKAVRDQYGKTPIHLLYYFLRGLFSNALAELDQIQESIEEREGKIFDSRESVILKEIVALKQNVIDFRRAVKPQHLTLESLVRHGAAIYGENVKHFLNDLVGEHLKVWELLENHKETLDALYAANNSLLMAKTNQIIAFFTFLAAITLIPSTISLLRNMTAFDFLVTIALLAPLLGFMVLKWRDVI